MKKKISLLCVFIFICSNLMASINFGTGDINNSDQVLYTVSHSIPGTYEYKSLFLSKIKNGENDSTNVLTCYPEKMEVLQNGTILQIRNRYGIGLYDFIQNKFEWKNVINTVPVNSTRLMPYSVSPNGKYCCYIEKTGYASGKLILQDVTTDKKIVIDEHAFVSYQDVPVKWNKDSSVLLYEKNQNIYFSNPEALLKKIEASEEFRLIGKGCIESVNWVNEKFLVYIDSDLLYKISSKELYTLGLYSQIIGKGTIIGRLPIMFNCQKDKFSIDESLSSLCIIQNEKVINCYKINPLSNDYLEVIYSKPYIDSKGSMLDSKILWTSASIPIIWVRYLPYKENRICSFAYKLTDKFTKLTDIQDSGNPVLNSNGTKVAFYSGSKVYVYDLKRWTRIGSVGEEDVISLTWKDNDNLLIGGNKTIKNWNVNTNKVDFIYLSSASNGFWNQDGNKIYAVNENGKSYTYNENLKTWKEEEILLEHKNITQNSRYRVFCGTSNNCNYENGLYVRTLAGKAVTKPFFTDCVKQITKPVKVSLIFDGYDNSDGLTRILYELNSYNLKGTFFLNGEFIRRYPKETIQISNSKNECASMFFTLADLTSKDFIIDEEFIRRGLARNEDEFYKLTDKELSLLWHAPYYKKNDNIIINGSKAGYSYVNSTQNVSDTVTFEKAIESNENYYSASDIIDRYIANIKAYSGGVVPITIGISKGTRGSYLYDYLDLLISAILDEGFEIVPVRELISK